MPQATLTITVNPGAASELVTKLAQALEAQRVATSALEELAQTFADRGLLVQKEGEVGGGAVLHCGGHATGAGEDLPVPKSSDGIAGDSPTSPALDG